MTFGNDRIVRKGEGILVYTGLEMPDWQVRKYRKIAVVLEERVYFIAQKDKLDRQTVRYTLKPWPDEHHDMPGRTIYYDAEYVRQRDQSRAEARRREAAFQALRIFKPLIGFLPSAAKSQLEIRYGISARGATFSSLFVELVLFFAVGVAVWIETFGSLVAAAHLGAPVSSPLLIGLLFFLLLETAIRYSDYLNEARSPYGFCEWLFRRRANSPQRRGERGDK